MNGRGERRNIDTDSKRESKGGLTVLVFFCEFCLLQALESDQNREGETK